VAARASLVPMVVPVVIVLGFYFGVFTATEAGALVAAYAVGAALLYYRNVSPREMLVLIHESALLTAAVVFLLAVASVYQFLMGMLGVPAMLGALLQPLRATPWLFLLAVPVIVILFVIPDPLQHRAHGGRRHRALPAADRRRAAHGSALRERLGGPALPRVLALSRLARRRTDDPDPVPGDHAVSAPARGAGALSASANPAPAR